MKSQEQFEAWATSRELDTTRWQDGYANETTQAAWCGWLGAKGEAVRLTVDDLWDAAFIAALNCAGMPTESIMNLVRAIEMASFMANGYEVSDQ